MQIFAKNEEGELILAADAKKGEDYICAECGETLRLRAGLKEPHFFHLRRLNKRHKTPFHQEIQYQIQSLFPSAELEKRFPQIQRIADVAVEKEKRIFEVQCSKIPQREIEKRTEDYRSIGWSVIWIFHSSHWNSKKPPIQNCCFVEESRQFYANGKRIDLRTFDFSQVKPIKQQRFLRLYKRLFYRFLRHLFE